MEQSAAKISGASPATKQFFKVLGAAFLGSLAAIGTYEYGVKPYVIEKYLTKSAAKKA